MRNPLPRSPLRDSPGARGARERPGPRGGLHVTTATPAPQAGIGSIADHREGPNTVEEKMKVRALTVALCAGLLVAGAAAAQDAKPADKPMSAEEKAMMDAWAKFATPAEGHRALAGMVGTWDAEVTSWMSPGQPPVKSKGISENRMVLGGRWVESKFTSEMMGQPFEGVGYTGYDNHKKKYMGTWMDNMSTAVM